MVLIHDVVQQAITTSFLTVRAEEKLRQLLRTKYDIEDLNAFITLRHNLYTARIPFIFLTAKTDVAERCYGIKLGADDYLTKPCTVKDLMGAIVRSAYLMVNARVCELTQLSSHYD